VIALPRLDPPLNVVLVEPQIPPNTGNVARLCSVTGCRLHLVGPLGFSIADKEMRRAGLDYWFGLWKAVYRDLEEYLAEIGTGPDGPRLHLFTARAGRSLWDLRFRAGDHLVFGSEPLGLPTDFLASRPESQVGLPMLPDTRSLNLSSAVAVGVYEALRQIAPATAEVSSSGEAG
jgi:tRNA (cytidine/uridine-2'-O-)-methyltransferase